MAGLLKLTGREYAISESLPVSSLVGEMVRRGADLMRGILKYRRVVFVGPRVRVRGASKMKLGRGVAIGRDTELDARGLAGLQLGDASRLGRNGILTTTSKLSLMGVGLTVGDRSGIGDNFHIGASGGVVIGRDVIVGPGLTVHSQSHVYDQFDRPIRNQGTIERSVTIADDCWIGSNVTFLSGASIGPHTVVASGAVVKDQHPGFEVLGGIPARQLKPIAKGPPRDD